MPTANQFVPTFPSPEAEIAYLREKVAYLVEHAHLLADADVMAGSEKTKEDLIELHQIKNSRSWKITKPLREMSRIAQAFRTHMRK